LRIRHVVSTQCCIACLARSEAERQGWLEKAMATVEVFGGPQFKHNYVCIYKVYM